MHPQNDLAHLDRIDPVAIAQRDHGVDQRMQHHAAGVGLMAVALDQPAVAEAGGQLVGRGVAVDAREAALAFDDLLGRVEAAPASRAASTPFDAALPAWNDLHMVPRFCCMPAACVAAMPIA